MDPDPKDTRSPETFVAHALHSVEEATGSVVPPLHTATTFARDADYQLRDRHLYSRYGNPTIDQAEEIIARLENGHDALVFASGLAGIAALFETLRPGAQVVAPEIMYWGTRDLMTRMLEKQRITATYVDPTDLEALKVAVVPGKTELVWIETPVNPVWDVIDIKAVADIAHAAGAELAVDFNVRQPGCDPSPGPWRGYCLSFHYKIPQRPFRCAGWRAGDPRGQCTLGGSPDGAQCDRRHSGTV